MEDVILTLSIYLQVRNITLQQQENIGVMNTLVADEFLGLSSRHSFGDRCSACARLTYKLLMNSMALRLL